MATAIVLNGTSSSGKTTLAKALQNTLDEPWLHFQMDAFWDMVPPHMQATSKTFPRMKHAMMASAKALLDFDHNIVIDVVCAKYDKNSFAHYLEQLGNHTLYVVAVTAPLPVLESREKQRPDRVAGLAKSQYYGIHDDYPYDFIADTSQKDPQKDLETLAHEIALAVRA